MMKRTNAFRIARYPHHGMSDIPWLPATAAKTVIALNTSTAQ
jgi:hypothetical protein